MSALANLRSGSVRERSVRERERSVRERYTATVLAVTQLVVPWVGGERTMRSRTAQTLAHRSTADERRNDVRGGETRTVPRLCIAASADLLNPKHWQTTRNPSSGVSLKIRSA